MEKTSYHHGALREELIKQGIKLLNEEGVSQFSLRRVAALCKVSHTAPYKHFKSKEEFIECIIKYIMGSFSEEIRKVAKEHPGDRCLLEIGKRYVTYMLEHQDYFNLLFLGQKNAVVTITDMQFGYETNHPFSIFTEVATDYLKEKISDEGLRNRMILQCWSSVHGLVHLVISGVVKYDGNYGELADMMLSSMNLY
ncbi:MAG: TetR/AcrR family transcriptional regulator [Cellulosilyticum sp.]|nr:TetR/AcrR family transcriptional regulator [Cellulosilyticum sp.]